jgi:addiction module HigA family antidote
MTKIIAPVHPGEILLEDFLIPMGISQNKLALAMRVPANRVNEIIHGKRAVTAETALRFGLALGTSPDVWMNLQAIYDLRMAEETIGDRLRSEVLALSQEQ